MAAEAEDNIYRSKNDANFSSEVSAAASFFDAKKVQLIKFFESNPALWDSKSGKDASKAKGRCNISLSQSF